MDIASREGDRERRAPLPAVLTWSASGETARLFAVPDHFTTPTVIEGLLATDIFTLNAPLAATIEESFVNTLNTLRPVWDPDSQYQTYSFVRQSQTFPDVILRAVDNGSNPLRSLFKTRVSVSHAAHRV